MIYFTSDTHFFHNNIIKACNRPFASVEEMNDGLIKNWNNTVSPKDTIYHLGDFAFCKGDKAIEVVKQLNGHKHLVFGNHDKMFRKNQEFLSFFESFGDIKEIKLPIDTLRKYSYPMRRKIVMCHYAMRVWNHSHYGSIHLFGHSHNTMKESNGLSLDVGVDAWNYKPVSIEEIILKLIKDRCVINQVDYHEWRENE